MTEFWASVLGAVVAGLIGATVAIVIAKRQERERRDVLRAAIKAEMSVLLSGVETIIKVARSGDLTDPIAALHTLADFPSSVYGGSVSNVGLLGDEGARAVIDFYMSLRDIIRTGQEMRGIEVTDENFATLAAEARPWLSRLEALHASGANVIKQHLS